jgi:flavin reductase (DIM6/NTAB) family NADH-FMN oxidoreductase RutF
MVLLSKNLLKRFVMKNSIKKDKKKTNLFIFFVFFVFSSCISQTHINDMENFEKISWEQLDDNAIRMIGKDWMLISAGSTDNGFNMMTASWGGLGFLWQKPVSFIFVRPQRYTFEFTEKGEYYTMTFFEEEHRDILRHMGTVSGRDFDKINESGLTPVTTENGSTGFAEAKLIIECRKLYAGVINPDDFTDTDLDSTIYPSKDYHTMYIGEIVNVWRKK